MKIYAGWNLSNSTKWCIYIEDDHGHRVIIPACMVKATIEGIKAIKTSKTNDVITITDHDIT